MDLPSTVYRVSLKALITKDDKLLFIRYSNDMLDLPGGGYEYEEDNELECLSREVEEEIGVKIKSYEKRPVCLWRGYKKIHWILLGYKVELDSFDFHFKEKSVVSADFLSLDQYLAGRKHPNMEKFNFNKVFEHYP
jgi:8-oxo-dGTP pyrophosphatase MutT (NUDIX family)